MLRTLDFFILTLVRDGIRAPYDWQARAGVSLGASLPAVRRLLGRGLVSEAEKGSRGRREFTITSSGQRELQKSDLYLEQALENGNGDLESVLRLVCIAISEAKTESARKLLLHSAEEHAKRSRRAKRGFAAPAKGSSVADLYSAALAHCEASRQDATSKSLASLSSVLGIAPEQSSPVRRRRKSTR
jgi:DNA-binding PadR family transcriptional regulator